MGMRLRVVLVLVLLAAPASGGTHGIVRHILLAASCDKHKLPATSTNAF